MFETSSKESTQPRYQGRLPLQQSVSSASQIPVSPTKGSLSPQFASARYVQQCRALMEHQRQVFDEERALWHTERQELQEKLTQVEAMLRQCQANSGNGIMSPYDAAEAVPGGRSAYVNIDYSKHATISTGDEFWRGAGGKSGAQPTRTFSDSSTQSIKLEERRLPSIAEDDVTHGSRAPRNCSNKSNGVRKSSLQAVTFDKNLDGINFKPNGLPPAIVQSVMTESPSSHRSESPAHASPGFIALPSSSLQASEDPYIKDAGHTPLIRRGSGHQDGSSSVTPSESHTPTKPEKERPPLEPHSSTVKIPSERAKSYFPQSVDDINEDPGLKGPLSLNNSKAEDKGFLNELDSKLLQAVRASTQELPDISESNNADKDSLEEGKGPDPEPEPKLRIKRSMNFGSAFGAARCGKDI
ncbi:hypothetical protein MMC12_003260 [Toensbergia leucococca]|nr:hypothetical protein [Toensbergia leucococca]